MTSSFTWGQSRAADRVRAQVSGLRPSKAASRLFMVMQAYIDESVDQDGTFVLGGYLASAEAWAEFSGEWEQLLRPFGTLGSNGAYHFKMQEMAMNDERMERVCAFFRIIENHVLGWVSAKINMNDLKRAMKRISVPNGRGWVAIDWGMYANPYFITFRALMDRLHLVREDMAEVIPVEEKIDFYFDNRTEKRAILEMWDNYIAARPHAIRNLYGATPRFEDDTDFLPLQAADFWCWWVRKWYAAGTPEKISECDFGKFKLLGKRKFLRIEITYDEDSLVESLKKSLRRELPAGYPIYEMKKSWWEPLL